MITRRRFVGLAGVAALLALSGCATPVTNPSDSAIPEPEPEGAANTTEYEQIAKGDDAMTGPALIAYFSCTGTTKRIAGIIEETAGADMFQIVPQQPYTEADLAYYTGAGPTKSRTTRVRARRSRDASRAWPTTTPSSWAIPSGMGKHRAS